MYSEMLLLCSYGNTGVTSGNYVHIMSLEVSVHSHPQFVGGSCTIIIYNHRGRNYAVSIALLYLYISTFRVLTPTTMPTCMHWMACIGWRITQPFYNNFREKTPRTYCSLAISNKRSPRISKNIQEYPSSLALLSRFCLIDSEKGTRQNSGRGGLGMEL